MLVKLTTLDRKTKEGKILFVRKREKTFPERERQSEENDVFDRNYAKKNCVESLLHKLQKSTFSKINVISIFLQRLKESKKL